MATCSPRVGIKNVRVENTGWRQTIFAISRRRSSRPRQPTTRARTLPTPHPDVATGRWAHQRKPSPTSPIGPSRAVASKLVRRSDYQRNTNACCRIAAGAFSTPMVKVFTTKLPSLAVDWTRIE